MKKKIVAEPSSFRDPAGFVFYQDGRVYRQVNQSYRDHFEFFSHSSLYDGLAADKLILPFTKVSQSYAVTDDAYALLEMPKIPFVSYPYEWSFSQLKDAAETILTIQKIALAHGMSLKDASAFNIQFVAGRPVLIDILSFEKYKEGAPWIAYRQFCQHFLAPLALMSYRDVRLGQLLKTYLDGIPLDLASAILPKRTWLNFALVSHIHLHAKTQQHFAKSRDDLQRHPISISYHNLLSIVDNLIATVKSLQLKLKTSQWGDYYSSFSYTGEAFAHKKSLVSRFLDLLCPATVWDLGANTGELSRTAASRGVETVSFDADFLAVEKNYRMIKKNRETRILPLVVNLTNPTPSLGWENCERKSLIERGPADCVLVLAFIHHLAIANNLPFEKIADFLSQIANSLIIEFIAKEDLQVQKLLSTREDIFSNYNQNSFEETFHKFFRIVAVEKILASDRTIYCMKKTNNV